MYEERGRNQMPGIAADTEPALDLEQAFEEHHAMVFRTAYRITGNTSDAEDVLQTVFLRLLRRTGDAGAVGHLPKFH